MTFPEHMLRKLFSATVHLCCSTDAGISVGVQVKRCFMDVFKATLCTKPEEDNNNKDNNEADVQ